MRVRLKENSILHVQTEFNGFFKLHVYNSGTLYKIRVFIKEKKIMGQNEDYLEAIRHVNKKNDERLALARAGIDVNNAGIMLISAYFPMLFHRLGLLADNRREFESTNDRIRAIFLIQYLLYGEQCEWEEPELYLNKMMVGMEEYNQPLPRTCELSQEETDMAEDMIKVICHNWDKMRNTSISGFRVAFLQRRGQVMLHEDLGKWEVTVEQEAYDLLIDSIPWEYKMCKYPWQKKIIEVKWR